MSFLVSHCPYHVIRENILLPPSGFTKYWLWTFKWTFSALNGWPQNCVACNSPNFCTPFGGPLRPVYKHSHSILIYSGFPLNLSAIWSLQMPIVLCVVCAHECRYLKTQTNQEPGSVSLQSHDSLFLWNTAGFFFPFGSLRFITAVQSWILELNPQSKHWHRGGGPEKASLKKHSNNNFLCWICAVCEVFSSLRAPSL